MTGRATTTNETPVATLTWTRWATFPAATAADWCWQGWRNKPGKFAGLRSVILAPRGGTRACGQVSNALQPPVSTRALLIFFHSRG